MPELDQEELEKGGPVHRALVNEKPLRDDDELPDDIAEADPRELEMDTKIQIAANLKAAGYTWKQVGRVLGYAEGTSVGYMFRDKHREKWMRAYKNALDHYLLEELEPASILMLKQIALKWHDESDAGKVGIAQRALKTLLKHTEKLRADLVEVKANVEHSEADNELVQTVRTQLDRIADSEVEGSESPLQDALPYGSEGQSEEA